jgi:hypothetical protein
MLKVIGKRKDSQGCSRKPNIFLIWATEKETFALFLGIPDRRIFYNPMCSTVTTPNVSVLYS